MKITFDTMLPAKRLEDGTETLPTPNDMPPMRAAGVFFKLPTETLAAMQPPETIETPEVVEADEQEEITLPREGGSYEDEYGKYTFEPVIAHIYDPRTRTTVEKPYSLRMWFAHHTDEIEGGPGWDGRFKLASMSPEEMLRRYGHEFTMAEIRSPGGYPTGERGKLEGGMPDDIVYYDTVPVKEAGSDDIAR